MAEPVAQSVVNLTKEVTWGRKSKAGASTGLWALAIVLSCPTLIYFYSTTLRSYGGSLTAALIALRSEGALAFASQNPITFSTSTSLGYVIWVLLQALLYRYLPGPACRGQLTPGGNLLGYTTNGLDAWAFTHLLYLVAAVLGLLDPAVIAKNWDGLLMAANAYGFLIAFMAQFKGYLAPSFPEDQKMTGSWMFDFWAGVELNPRLGKIFDVKFFHNGRPGILAWTLIDLSWAAYQYHTLGVVTRSMLLVILFHSIYVVDFFYNESWYTRTIDISHDHFGFMLAWGDSTFLPAFYSLQSQYLARYPTHLTGAQTFAILAIGLIGYTVFRSANFQRDQFRAKKGELNVWGSPAKYIACSYQTSDGNEHKSILLVSGWWGLCRHFNYVGDLVLTFAMCAPCGFKHILPWSYFFYMCILLNHRTRRDERRCRLKYGKKWEEYCAIVPYRLIPGVY